MENLFETLHAADVAECLIVGTTLKLAKEIATALVGEDTDVLVLLLFHVQREHCTVLFRPVQILAKGLDRLEISVRTPCLVMQ